MRPFSIAVVIALLCSHFVLAFPSPGHNGVASAGARSGEGSPMNVDENNRSPSPMDVDGHHRSPSPMDIDEHHRSPSPMDVDEHHRSPSPMDVDDKHRSPSPMEVDHSPHSSPMRTGREGSTRNRDSSPPKNQHALGATPGGRGGMQRRPSTGIPKDGVVNGGIRKGGVRKGGEAVGKPGHPTPHSEGRPPRHANQDRSKNRVGVNTSQRPSRSGQRTSPQSPSAPKSKIPVSRHIKRSYAQ